MTGKVTRDLKQSGNSGVPQIAVVIPAFCAASHIQSVLAGIPKIVSYIIVVDDCSPDNTAELANSSSDTRVHVVSLQENQGVGGATLIGYDTALELGAEIIVKMDSDDQMDPNYILPLVTPILSGEADYTKGNRFLHLRQLQSMPYSRRIGNMGLSFLTKLASGYWNIFDPANGFTAIHSLLIPELNRVSIDRRFFFESSLLLELGLLRAVVRDVFIPARYGGQHSFLSERKALFTFPPRLLKGLFRRLVVQYFLRDFTIFSILFPVGSLLTIWGILFGGYEWYLSAVTGRNASTGTVMLAVLPIILGIQLLLQAVLADMQNVPMIPLNRELHSSRFEQVRE